MQKQNKAKFRSFIMRLQCILSVMLIVLMIFTTVFVEAFAKDDEMNGLMIAGLSVTEKNASDLLGNGIFSYDNNTKTLTVITHKNDLRSSLRINLNSI